MIVKKKERANTNGNRKRKFICDTERKIMKMVKRKYVLIIQGNGKQT